MNRQRKRKMRVLVRPESKTTAHAKGFVDVSIHKRGGTGPAAKLNPGPRTVHIPKPKVQVVCE
jgi:hypothetical protein